MAVVIIQELLLVCIFSIGWKITDSLVSPWTGRKSRESEHRVRNLQGREKKTNVYQKWYQVGRKRIMLI